VDAVDGLVPKDLGDLIWEYTTHNLIQPLCSLARVFPNMDHCVAHHVAGYLGVYGNIATATFLHGAVMLQTVDSPNRLNIAGDDGLIDSNYDKEKLDALATIGIVEETKAFSTEEGGAVHLKRPITQIGNRLLPGLLVPWPSLEYLSLEQSVDPRYPHISNMSKDERRTALAASITTFLSYLTTTAMTADDHEYIFSFLKWLYQEGRLPEGGNVPQISGTPLGFVPAIRIDYIGLEPITNTIGRMYPGWATLIRRAHMPFEKDMLEQREFLCNGSKCLRYLEDLGYLSSRKESVYVVGEEGLQALLKEYLNPDAPVYRYKLDSMALPEWLENLLLL